jgi:hypothetical protein
MIPRKLHFVWVGNEADFPEECVQTWRQQHPDWELTVWGNDSLAINGWRCGAQIRQLFQRDLRGVADCMRWDILYNEGGVVIDADMVSLRPLPEWLLECQIALPWLNELAYPGLLSTVMVAAEPGNPLVGEILLRIQDDPELFAKPIPDATGAGRLLALRNHHKYQGVTLLPSHFFLPRMPHVATYDGTAPVYAYKKFYAAMGSRAVQFQEYLTPFRPGRIDLKRDGPLLTVGIANYNRADYLGLAIASVLEQDYGRFELLIVDDGSTDHSDEVVASFADSRIRFVKKEHSGIPRTLNRVLIEAQGTHVVWLGNDDLLMQGILRDYSLLLQSWPEVVFAYGDLIRIDSAGSEIDRLQYTDLFGDRILLSRFLLGNMVPAPGSMANLAVMRAIGGFDNEIPDSNDYDMWVRLASTGLPFKHVGRASCKYRLHAFNSSSRVEALAADDLKVLHKMLATYDLRRIFADLEWVNDPRGSELTSCHRIVTLLTKKNDHSAADLWVQRLQMLQNSSDTTPSTAVQI